MNVWSKFSAMLPKGRQNVGTLISNDATRGVCSITLLSGDTIQAYGTGEIGAYYLVEGNTLIRKMEAKQSFNAIL